MRNLQNHSWTPLEIQGDLTANNTRRRPGSMAFFLSSISASIVKRLFLFTLSRLDILDQDPSDFVEVSVGKTSTLELRDVGIRVKVLCFELVILKSGF